MALGLSSFAAAEPRPVRASLELRAPDACGAPRALLERVERRSARIRFEAPGAGVRRVRAEVQKLSATEYRALLSLWSSEGRELVRELRAGNCAEAFDALALVIAVTLDPDADLGSEGQGGSRPSRSSAAPASSDPASEVEAETAERSEGAAPDRRAAAPAAPSERPTQKAAASPSGRPLVPSFGVLGALRSGPAPGVMPGLGLFVALDGLPGFPERSLLRLSAARYSRGDFEASGGVAEFELDALRLDVCPLGLGHGPLRLHGCLELELGELEAAGTATIDARKEARPWRSLGAAASLGYSPLPVLELGALAGLEHPLVRDRFEFEPEAFHEVGPLGARVELTLGLRLP